VETERGIRVDCQDRPNTDPRFPFPEGEQNRRHCSRWYGSGALVATDLFPLLRKHHRDSLRRWAIHGVDCSGQRSLLNYSSLTFNVYAFHSIL